MAEQEQSTELVTTAVSLGEFLTHLGTQQELTLQQELMSVYDRAVQALISPNDYQDSPDGRRYKRKSAWRKLARYFHISTEIVTLDGWWETDETSGQRHYKARCIVRATAPWGQSVEAAGGSATREPRFWYHDRRSGKWQPRIKAFMKADHDCEATAATRATNRAVSDLIAAAELSAEEMDGTISENEPTVPEPPTVDTSQIGEAPTDGSEYSPTDPIVWADAEAEVATEPPPEAKQPQEPAQEPAGGPTMPPRPVPDIQRKTAALKAATELIEGWQDGGALSDYSQRQFGKRVPELTADEAESLLEWLHERNHERRLL